MLFQEIAGGLELAPKMTNSCLACNMLANDDALQHCTWVRALAEKIFRGARESSSADKSARAAFSHYIHPNVVEGSI